MKTKKYVYNQTLNQVAIIQHNGVHRVYYNNKRSGTKLWLNRIGQDKVLSLLLTKGYKEINEIEFNNYFL